MDGVNEPKFFKANPTMNIFLEKEKINILSPNTIGIYNYITTKSAFLNAVKKFFFFFKLDFRRKKISDNNFSVQKKWFNTTPIPLKYDSANAEIRNAVDTFFQYLTDFDSTLSSDEQNHLLLVQPHISLRDTNKMPIVEKSVYNYYSHEYNLSETNQFLKSVYKEKNNFPNSICFMDDVHSWDGWVFVDYCHFTSESNKKISDEIMNYILNQKKPFAENSH